MSFKETSLTLIQFYGIMEGVSFSSTFMIDIKNIEGVSSRNTF